MRQSLLYPVLAFVISGCASGSSYVRSETTLGRVVVYRNGVAYFERYAELNDDSLKLAVPADKVDDFLKSLTVVDAKTGAAAPIAYPTNTPRGTTGIIDMKIALLGPKPHALRLSYVTEAPSWKPSYRVVLDQPGKVHVQAWAIVDNTSGEDWNNVKLGVGASSALSFRFDLRSIRTVERETLQAHDLFAIAPPTGESIYLDKNNGQAVANQKTPVVMDLSDQELARADLPAAPPPAREASATRSPRPMAKPSSAAPAGVGTYGAGYGGSGRGSAGPAAGHGGLAGGDGFGTLAQSIQSQNRRVVIEGYAEPSDGDRQTAALERANRARDQLIQRGVDPKQIVAVAKDEVRSRGGIRVVDAPADAKAGAPAPTTAAGPGGVLASGFPAEPIGSSHFESGNVMNVPRGTSAMVSILNTTTEGEAVYLYDSESTRGNAMYPFRAVRIKNPTDSALESGPVTVFGDNRFIGEGLCEPIPAKATAFIPYALDRQIVIERKGDESDQISRILTAQRGVFTTETMHKKRTTLSLHNRLAEKAVVYLRHTMSDGYKLVKGPDQFERIGRAHLFRVVLEPSAKRDVVIEEDTPIQKTTDIRSPGALEMVRVHISKNAEAPLRASIDELVKIEQDIGTLEERIATTRRQIQEYRQRMDELHAQIVTLKAVKTAGPLMRNLEKKLQEVGDKISKLTVDVVGHEESLMIARVRFQDRVAELTLEKPKAAVAEAR